MRREVVHKNILFTGLPGYGKSTVIEKIVQQIKRPSAGFFTREIRDRGRRMGFSITTLEGKHGILAHIDIRSHIRVGRYGVNLQDMEGVGHLPMIEKPGETAKIYLSFLRQKNRG